MPNSPDLSPLLSLVENGEIKETLNRVGRLLEARTADKTNSAYPVAGALVNHVDPGINLLLAITPFLSESKRSKVETLLKPLNVLFFLRQFLAMADREDGI
ncbi:MAG: hypothetical protein GX167_05165 [Firmicutes bacterium]|jgi:hypothetical protein|nr:hypothetical protein [Bacillota bacterium]